MNADLESVKNSLEDSMGPFESILDDSLLGGYVCPRRIVAIMPSDDIIVERLMRLHNYEHITLHERHPYIQTDDIWFSHNDAQFPVSFVRDVIHCLGLRSIDVMIPAQIAPLAIFVKGRVAILIAPRVEDPEKLLRVRKFHDINAIIHRLGMD